MLIESIVPSGALFHATSEEFEAFDLQFAAHFGLHFGSLEQAQTHAERLSEHRILAVSLRPSGVVRIEDLGTWSFENVARECIKLGLIDRDDYESAWQSGDSSGELRKILVAKGVDAFVYENAVEGEGDSWVALTESIITIESPGEMSRQRGDSQEEA